jgi:hypothetical protein
MTNWTFHDSYKTKEDAQVEGENIVKVGLAKGVKIIKEGKKSRPFLLYILPLKETKGEK